MWTVMDSVMDSRFADPTDFCFKHFAVKTVGVLA